MKRVRLFLPLAVLLLAWASCTTVKHLQLDDAMKSPKPAPDGYAAQAVVGYTTQDAVYHPYVGFARLEGADSIGFYHAGDPKHLPPGASLLDREFSLARTEVQTLAVQRTKTLATIGTVVLITTVVVAIIVAATADEDPPQYDPQTTTSCPLVYSWDGGKFMLDAEPFGGATIRALERTDVTELEHLAADSGGYRLLVTNEMEETQYTNRLELLVVDHAPGLTLAPGPDGALHGFANVAPLVEARDGNGRDVLAWLAAKDQAIWHPDLDAASRDLPRSDPRDHLVLTFDRPAGIHQAWLLADAATAPWGARMIRPLLEMRGATIGLFYAAINLDEGSRRKLHQWNEREELFTLGVEVEEEGRWVRQASLLGGGPIATETRGIPLDLRRVTGDRVRVRIHPPIGFWALNAFRLGWAEAPLRVQVVAPRRAEDAAGGDVLASLARTDDAYLTFASNEDHAVVEFPAPPPHPGEARSVFARTRGWYDIRTQGWGPPDLAEIGRVTDEPGHVVQIALRRYREATDRWLARKAAGGPRLAVQGN